MEQLDRKEIGMRLYQAETAIGLGRRAIKALQHEEPVDEEAVEIEREHILRARLERNELRKQLAKAKQAEAMRGYSWTTTE